MTTCALAKQINVLPGASCGAPSLSSEPTPSLMSPQSTDNNSTSDCNKKPRKNRSAYTLFALDIKPKLKASSNYKMSCVDLQTTISQMWKALSPEERKKYQDQANEEKLHYMLKLKKFYENASPETIEEATKPKPKRPYSAYCYFVKEIRHVIKLPDAKYKMQEILKQASEKWRTLSEEEKNVYQEKAKQAREAYTMSETMDSAESVESGRLEESFEPAGIVCDTKKEEKKKVEQAKERKASSINRKRGLHFPKEIREKMEKLDRQSPNKKVKAGFFGEVQSNFKLFNPQQKASQSTEINFETILRQQEAPAHAENSEIKQETMEKEMLKPLPEMSCQIHQPKPFWPGFAGRQTEPVAQNISMPQPWNLQVPKLNPRVMTDISMAVGYEQVKRQIIEQLLMRKLNQMVTQQSLSVLLGQQMQMRLKNENL